MASRVLIIESDQIHAESLQRFLTGQGYRVEIAQSSESGIATAIKEQMDFLIIDTVLPDGDGFNTLKQINEVRKDIPAVILTGYGSIESAVRAMKLGALDYLVKPIDYDNLKLIIRRGMMKFQQESRRDVLETQRKNRYQIDRIIGVSPVFKAVLDVVKMIAASPAGSILLTGESGTGKELIAKALHYNSPRFGQAFVEINCAAIPEGLLEAELFGHERGAFTGAVREKRGLFEIADKGTIFLDEIGHMPLALQAKLVKSIEEKVFRRVGGEREMRFDARIIAATHRNLLEAVKDNDFRADLYYRLKVIHIELPSLRERGALDITVLGRHFIDEFNVEYGRNVKGFSPSAIEMINTYSWPGNVRQLRNAVERAVILDPGDSIDVQHLQLDDMTIKSPQKWDLEIPDSGIDLESIEKNLIEKALHKAGGNKTKAAKYLGLSRDAFRYRLSQIEKEP